MMQIQHFKLIRIRIQGFDDQKLRKKMVQLKKSLIFFWSKIAIYLSLGPLKGRPRYGRSRSPQIRTSGTSNKLNLTYCGSFCPAGSGYGLQIRFQGPCWIRIQSEPATLEKIELTSFWRLLTLSIAASFSLLAMSAFCLAMAASFFHASQAVRACNINLWPIPHRVSKHASVSNLKIQLCVHIKPHQLYMHAGLKFQTDAGLKPRSVQLAMKVTYASR